ncbi:MAG: hypothetical protein CMO34_04295 [Verrucomicrobia bacterium]|nr:hypothetical protein [Verrucomicrobiota bacterium]
MKLSITGLLIAFILIACNSTDRKTDVNDQRKENSIKKQSVNSPSSIENKGLMKLNRAIVKDVNNQDLYLERAKLHESLGNDQAAFEDINRAYLIDSTHLETIIAQADYVGKRGQLELGMNILNKGEALYPEDAKIYAKKAELYLIGRNFSEALKQADLAVKFDPYFAHAYYIKGFSFLEMGDTAKAISSHQTAVEQDPDFLESYLELGYIFSLKDDPLTLAFYKNALEVDPNNKRVLYSKGMYEQEHELYNEALESYHKAIAVDSNFKEAYFNLGFVHMFYLELYSESLKYFSRAMEIDPNYYQALYNRGYAFELMGDIKNAATDYRQALKVKPDYDLAANGLSRVQE